MPMKLDGEAEYQLNFRFKIFAILFKRQVFSMKKILKSLK